MKGYEVNLKMLVAADTPEGAAAAFVKSLNETPGLFRIRVTEQCDPAVTEVPYVEAMHDALAEATAS